MRNAWTNHLYDCKVYVESKFQRLKIFCMRSLQTCFNIIGIWICIKLTPLLMLVLLIEKPKFPDVGDTEATSFVLMLWLLVTSSKTSKVSKNRFKHNNFIICLIYLFILRKYKCIIKKKTIWKWWNTFDTIYTYINIWINAISKCHYYL